MKELTNILLSIIIIAIVFNNIYKNFNLTSVKSLVDGRMYSVRKLSNKQEASDKLAELSNNLTKLVDYVYKNYKDREGVVQLKTNFNSRNISENTPDAPYTAYSVNKGEELAICLRNKKDETFIESNLVIFVSIHELAHVMTDEVGHTPKFWDNMRFLLEQAVKLNIYIPEDYKKNPKNYCGLDINSTPYKFN